MTAFKPSTLFGKINHWHKADTTFFSLPCLADKRLMLSCFLLDEKGCAVWEETLIKTTDQIQLTFQVNHLKSGSYCLWIDVNGKMKMQAIKIVKPAKKRMISFLQNYFG